MSKPMQVCTAEMSFLDNPPSYRIHTLKNQFWIQGILHFDHTQTSETYIHKYAQDLEYVLDKSAPHLLLLEEAYAFSETQPYTQEKACLYMTRKRFYAKNRQNILQKIDHIGSKNKHAQLTHFGESGILLAYAQKHALSVLCVDPLLDAQFDFLLSEGFPFWKIAVWFLLKHHALQPHTPLEEVLKNTSAVVNTLAWIRHYLQEKNDIQLPHLLNNSDPATAFLKELWQNNPFDHPNKLTHLYTIEHSKIRPNTSAIGDIAQRIFHYRNHHITAQIIQLDRTVSNQRIAIVYGQTHTQAIYSALTTHLGTPEDADSSRNTPVKPS